MRMCAQVLIHASAGLRKYWRTQILVGASAENSLVYNYPRLALIEHRIESKEAEIYRWPTSTLGRRPVVYRTVPRTSSDGRLVFRTPPCLSRRTARGQPRNGSQSMSDRSTAIAPRQNRASEGSLYVALGSSRPVDISRFCPGTRP